MPILLDGDGSIGGVSGLGGGNFQATSLETTSGGLLVHEVSSNRYTLRVDATNNTVGINTSSAPAAGTFLQIADATDPIVSLNNTASGEVRLGCTATYGYIGTESNHPFNIEANSATAVTVLGNGNIGIGNSSPASLLDIRPGVTGSQNAITMGYGRAANPTDAVHKIRWASDDLIIEADSANTIASNIQFRNDGNEVMLIDSSSNVQIGGIVKGGCFHITDSKFTSESDELIRIIKNNERRFIVRQDGSATFNSSVAVGVRTAQKKLHVRDDSDSYPLLVQNRTNAVSTCGVALIATGSDFSDGQYATIEAISGGTGNTQHELRFRTCPSGGTPSERIRILANGGLTFNGDTAQVNALDDYEEGIISTAAFNGTVTYTGSLTGHYTKIGRVVYFSISYNNGVFSGATGGVAKITGLPFTVTSNSANRSGFYVGYNNVTVNESNGGYVEDGTTNIIFYDSGTKLTSKFLDGNEKYVNVSGFYLTD